MLYYALPGPDVYSAPDIIKPGIFIKNVDIHDNLNNIRILHYI
jgi:hypothetical protein